MDKMKMETVDMTKKNIDIIEKFFPNCITEKEESLRGGYSKAVNFKLLKQMLSTDVVDGEEAYEFTWVGKKASIVEAHKPIRKTLRPCKDESVDWDKTENLYIEGDNLDVLKLLQKSYLGKVKMIYIDPPYNTGSDFIYNDDFKMSREEYADETGELDEDGNRMFKNTNSNGRFHSDWCSMIYPRLLLARNLLSDDGVIFISIDDNEIDNMKKICNEILGEENFIAIINWRARGGRQDSKYYAAVHEYILCYAKVAEYFEAGAEIKTGDIYPKYDEIKNMYYKIQLLRKWGSNSKREDRPNLFYPINAPDGTEVYPIIKQKDKKRPSYSIKYDGRWRHSPTTMQKNIDAGLVEFIKDKDDEWVAYERIYEPMEGEEKFKKYTTWIDEFNNGTKILKNILEKEVFDYPKTPNLILRFLKMANIAYDDIILDFFSGSATTAHAVMQLNAEDGGKRKFIMVQLPEPCDKKSEAYKAGYKNICEIGKERIRRAGKKIKSENPAAENLDIGFRVLKSADSNMNDVYYSPTEYNQDLLLELADNIKSDRSDLDLLFGCLLDWGLPLSLPYSSEQIENCTVHNYNDGDLIACFAENIPDSVINKIAEKKPLRAVFRDSSFADSSAKINVGEIFKLLSPDTRVKVI